MTNIGILRSPLSRQPAFNNITGQKLPCLNFIAIGAILFGLAIPSTSLALECDASLAPTQDASSYSLRNNRCEGFYSTKKVAGITLDLIGFIKGRFNYATNPDEVIELMLPGEIPAEFKPVYIQAKPFSSLTYYRMDAVIEHGAILRWPVKDVLLVKNIQAKHIRAYGEYRYKSPDSHIDSSIIIPLIARSSLTASATTKDEYLRLYLRSLEDIDYITHDWNCINGKKDSVKQEEVIRAGKPIIIFVPETLSGTCLVNIQAILMNRDSGGEGNRIHKQFILQLAQ